MDEQLHYVAVFLMEINMDNLQNVYINIIKH